MVTTYSTLKTYASVFANATSIAATRRLNMTVVGVLSYEVLSSGILSWQLFFGTIAGGASGLSRIGTLVDGHPDGFYVTSP